MTTEELRNLIFLDIAPVLIGLVAIAVSWRTASLTKVLAVETKLSREATERAEMASKASNVCCTIQPHEEHAMHALLVITNIGKAVATDVSIRCSKVTELTGEEKELNLRFSNLLPDISWKTSIGLFTSLPALKFEAEIKFSDALGHHQKSYQQDISALFDLRHVSENATYEIAKSTVEIVKELHRIREGLAAINLGLNLNNVAASKHSDKSQAGANSKSISILGFLRGAQ